MQSPSYQRSLSSQERQRLYHSGCRHIQWGNMLHICPAISMLVCHGCYQHVTLDATRHECC